ncbi:hypothetical protein [Methanosarcina sp. UBA289]|nr:hypothetical protein [Methanosarcina sp. UBA289]
MGKTNNFLNKLAFIAIVTVALVVATTSAERIGGKSESIVD